MTEKEIRIMRMLVVTLNGEIGKMCSTNELSEFDTMYAYARENLKKLSELIYGAKFRTDHCPDWAKEAMERINV